MVPQPPWLFFKVGEARDETKYLTKTVRHMHSVVWHTKKKYQQSTIPYVTSKM